MADRCEKAVATGVIRVAGVTLKTCRLCSSICAFQGFECMYEVEPLA
jgi:hypothetical protein